MDDKGERTVARAGPIAACIILVAITLAVRLIPAWVLNAVVADIGQYLRMAEAAVRGDDVYATRALFPYTPYPMFLHHGTLLLAQATGWHFDFAAKLPAILADAALTILIFRHLWTQGLGLGIVIGWTSAWALNPVAILISAFHGSVHSLVPLFMVGALLAAWKANDHPNRLALLSISALLLGIAAGLRTFPALLIPLFLIFTVRNWREAILYVALAGIPGTVSSIPHLIYIPETFIRESLSYTGLVDFGWISVLRTVPYFLSGDKPGWVGLPLVQSTKWLFLLAYVAILLAAVFMRIRSAGRAIQLPSLLFYGLYGGVSAQYLVWVVPLGILTRDRLVFPFTLFSTMALVGFYVMYHPGILWGRNPALIQQSPNVMFAYAAGNIGVVIVSLIWVYRIISTEVHVYRHARSEVAATRPDAASWDVAGWAPFLGFLRRSRAYLAFIGVIVVAWAVHLSRVGMETRSLIQSLLR